MSVARMAAPVMCLWNQYAPFCAGVSLGGGIVHASPLTTDTADAIGHESLDPCFRPHMNTAEIIPAIVTMDTWLFVMLSAIHSTYPVGGHPSLSRLAHWYSRVIIS